MGRRIVLWKPMSQPEPPLHEKREAFERSIAAWNAGDFEGWLAYTHPQFEYEPGIVIGPAHGGSDVYRSRDRLRRMFDEFHSQWDMEFTFEGIEEIGDSTLFVGTARMTGTQSGATVEQKIAWVAQFEDGLCRRMQSYQSPEAARAAAADS
jgi:ketosteroid isomerase-like protein